MEITEFEPNASFGGIIREGDFEMPGRTTFEALGPERTRITLGAKMPTSLDRDLVERMMERSSRTIKDLVEAAD